MGGKRIYGNTNYGITTHDNAQLKKHVFFLMGMGIMQLKTSYYYAINILPMLLNFILL